MVSDGGEGAYGTIGADCVDCVGCSWGAEEGLGGGLWAVSAAGEEGAVAGGGGGGSAWGVAGCFPCWWRGGWVWLRCCCWFTPLLLLRGFAESDWRAVDAFFLGLQLD